MLNGGDLFGDFGIGELGSGWTMERVWTVFGVRDICQVGVVGGGGYLWWPSVRLGVFWVKTVSAWV